MTAVTEGALPHTGLMSLEESGPWLRKGLLASLTLSAILWLGPYWTWNHTGYFRLSVLLAALLFAVALGAGKAALSFKNLLIALLLLLLLLYFASRGGEGAIYPASSGWLALLVFVLADDSIKRDTYRLFAVVFAITLVPGMVVFVLSVFGIDVPWEAVTARRFDYDILRGDQPGYFRMYLGSIIRNDQIFPLAGGSLIRLHGIYEEPGVVGTISALLLVADGAKLKGRPHNIALLVGGVMSFSLAFFAIMFLYLLARRPLTTTVTMAVVVTIVTTSTAIAESPVIRLFFLNRLTMSGGQLLADNRVSSLFSALYNDFWNSGLWNRLFGSAQDVRLLIDTGTFSYKLIIFSYGIVGAMALLAFLIIAPTTISTKKGVIILLSVLIASIYQRPDVVTLPYFLILLGGAANLRDRETDSAAGVVMDAASASPPDRLA